MPTFENTRTILGEAGALDALLAHTLTTVADDELLQLSVPGLANQPQLETIYLPNANRIDAGAVYGSEGVKRVFFGLNYDTVQTLNYDEIKNTRRAIYYVPDSLVNGYKSGIPSNRLNWAELIFGVSQADTGALEWEETEITDSWAQILERCANGTAAATYHPGQYKAIDLGTEGSIDFQIIAKNADELAEGNGTASLTWFNRERGLQATTNMNPPLDGSTIGTGAIGGMNHCAGQTFLDESIFPLMPQELQAGIKTVKKYTAYTNGSNTRVRNEMTTHKLWFPSYRELGSSSSENESMGPMYTMGIPDSDARKRKAAISSSTISYWMRTGYDKSRFNTVTASGGTTSSYTNNRIPICFGFCT